MPLFTNTGFKSGSINECPQSLPVTQNLYVWLVLKKMFGVEFEYFV